MELVLQMVGEKNLADELSLQCSEISADNADRNPVLSILLPNLHSLLAVDLDNRSALVEIASLAQMLHLPVLLHVLALLHHRHGLPSQRAFIDQQLSLQQHALKGDLAGLIDKNNISRHDIERRDIQHPSLPQHVQIDLVVGHLEELIVCSHDFVYRYEDASDRAHDDHHAVRVVVDLQLDQQVSDEEDVERPEDFLGKDLAGCGLVDDHGSRPEGLSHFLSVVVAPAAGAAAHAMCYLFRQGCELCGLDSAVPDEVLEIAVGKEGKRFVLFAIEKAILFFFNNHSLVVVVDDVDVRGFVHAGLIVYHPPL